MKFLPVMRNVLCAPVAAVCTALFMLAPSEALGQSAKSTRAPHILQHDGKRFAAYVDEKSGTATWIIDTDSLDFSPGNTQSFFSKESVSAAADAFLDAHAGVFGIDTKQLSEPRVETNGTFWFVSYTQVYEGLRVLGAQVGVTITYSGRIVGAGARAFPKLDVQVGAQISRAAAIAFARGQTTIPQTEAVVKQNLVIVPEELTERYVFRLAWEVILENRDHDLPFSKTFLVDAHTGAIIAEHSNILESSSHGQGRVRLAGGYDLVGAEPAHASSSSSVAAAVIPYALPHVDIPEENIFGTAPPKPERREPAPSGTSTLSGTVTLNYYESPADYNNDPVVRHENQPFPYAKVIVQNDATQETHEVYADSLGRYEVSGLADTTHTVTFEIANDKAYIFRGLSTCEKERSFSIDIDGDTTNVNHNWGWGDSGDGRLTAFALNGVYHVREMYDYFANTYRYDGMDEATYKIRIFSSNQGGIFTIDPSYPKRIWLGGPYAMSNDVVLHEFTHDVIYTLHTPDSAEDRPSGPEYYAMDEGFSDYFAADKTNNDIFGGPKNDSSTAFQEYGRPPIRFMYNNCTMDNYDDDSPTVGKCGTDPHYRGSIIAGAIWQIRKARSRPAEHTGATASQLLFTALQIPPYAATFEALRDRYAVADRNSNNGDYAATIEEKFVDRKIGGPVMPGIPNITVDSQTRNPEITWRDNSLLEDGYRVERKRYAGAWSVIADLDDDTEAYTDTSYQCISGQSGSKDTYSYRIVPYKTFTSGIDTVSTASAAVALYLNTCTTETASRIADASDDAEMMSDARIQVQERKVPTGLEAPHPNPFNPVTTIRYGLAEEGPVRLTVYDVLGRRVAVLLDGVQTPGKHTVRFEASHLSSGLYFVIFDAGGKTFTKSVLLMK